MPGSKQVARHSSVSAPLPWWWVWPLGWGAGAVALWQQATLLELDFYKLISALSLVSIGLVAILKSAIDNPTKHLFRTVVLVVALASLSWSSGGWRAVQRQADILLPTLEGITLQTTVVVDDLPRATPTGWRFAARPQGSATVVASGQQVELPQRVLLGWYAPPDSAAPRAGERWQLAVRLRRPHGLANPHGFDSELWLWEQGVGATGYVRLGKNDPPPVRLSAAEGGLEPLRESVRAQVFERVPDRRVAGVLAALVVGDQAAIERGDWDVFRATGVAHLVSISGLHITLWAWLATLAVGRCWRWAPRLSPVWGSRLLLACPAPVAAAWGGGLLALGYALFSGWGIPAQRTVLMLAVVLGLRLLGLRWPWHAVAGVALAVVLTWDPWAGLQPGFWLSFVAVGVLLASADRPPARRPFPGAPSQPLFTAPGLPWGTRCELLVAHAWRGLVQLGRTQWHIGLALAPLSMVLFGQMSVVGLVANLAAIPWVTFVVTPLALVAVLWPALWTPAAWAVQGFVQTLVWLSKWPWASVSVPAWPSVWAGAALAGGLLLVSRMPWAWRAVGLALVLPAALHVPLRPAPGEFELVATDVGQGSAVLVRTASTSVLIDAGPQYGPSGDAGQRVLLPLLQAWGDVPADVVLSHSDSDHVGGAPAVLAAYPGSRVWASFERPDLGTAWSDAALLQRVQARPGPWTRCEAGQTWTHDGVRFDVLHPTPDLYAARTSNNNLSCVVWVRGAHASALLTGDLDAEHEQSLLRRHSDDLRATVLMAPHHGSKHSSSMAFLEAVSPRWVLVQAGHRNRYGHPAPEVLGRYRTLALPWMATPECGAALWHSAHPDRLDCQRRTGARHWHWKAQTSDSAADTEPDVLTPN